MMSTETHNVGKLYDDKFRKFVEMDKYRGYRKPSEMQKTICKIF